jgi:hypothetical protein
MGELDGDLEYAVALAHSAGRDPAALGLACPSGGKADGPS